MGLIFEWDAKKAKSNLAKHGISFEEAATTFKDEDQITFEDDSSSYGEVRYLSIGMSGNLQLLLVVHAELDIRDSMICIRIISARKATRAEIKAYEKN